jgi:hypothetical protein
LIYLCIPAHNEEQTVGVVLWKIRQVLTEFPRDYQILVADDASTDRTADVLAPYARVLPLTVLRTRERRGYAASLELLLREAVKRSPYPRRDAIVTLQADFTDEPEDIVPLVKRIEQGADIVGGTPASTQRPELLDRWLLRWQRRMLQRFEWPENAGDPLSGFRAYRVSVIKRALDDAGENRLLTWDGPAANAELLRLTAPHARRIESIDLVHRPDRRQRPARATTWERTRALRRYVRGKQTDQLLPLAALAPDTVPPPRPLEVERARRSEMANGAPEPRRRNGRGRGTAQSGQAGRRQERAARAQQPRSRGSEGAATTPRRRKRGGVTDSGAGSAARQEARRSNTATAGEEPELTAPVAAAPGSEGTPGTEPGAAAPKKRRRRRRRKPASQRQAADQVQRPEGAAATAEPEAVGTAGEGGTDVVSQGITNGSVDEGGTGAPKKRRRRGGRRGGRRRRKSSAEAQGEVVADASGAMGDAGTDGGAEPAAVGGEPNENH